MTSVAYWFDLDGTLIDFDRPFAVILSETIGIDPDEEIHETFRRRLFVALEEFEEAPYRLGYEAIVETHDLSLDPEDAAREHRERELAASELVEGAVPILRRCGELGSVGILTNGDGPMQRAKIDHHGLADHVDAVVISNEVRLRKPDPAIFEEAANRFPADVSVYVGDMYEEDIVPALDAGFLPVHVRHDDGPPLSVARLASFGPLLGAESEAH